LLKPGIVLEIRVFEPSVFWNRQRSFRKSASIVFIVVFIVSAELEHAIASP
jgi:hypothetical protein